MVSQSTFLGMEFLLCRLHMIKSHNIICNVKYLKWGHIVFSDSPSAISIVHSFLSCYKGKGRINSFNLQLIKINLYKMYLFKTYDINTNYNMSTVRAPVFDRHQFFGTSEQYGKARGSLLSG